METKRKSRVSPEVLKRLHDYSIARVAQGQGVELLQKLGADDVEFLRGYQVGYLPADYLESLDTPTRRALKDRLAGDCLIVPACDENMQPVDLIGIDASRQMRSLSGSLQGLIGAKVASAFASLVIVFTFELAALLFKSDIRNILLLRGLDDAKLNAERLRLAGVESAKVAPCADAESIIKALEGIDCSIEDVRAQPIAATIPVGESRAPELSLVSHNKKNERAVFKAGDVCYAVEVGIDSNTKLEVRIERDGKVHLDRFDLAVEAARRRFATSAALRTKVPIETIEGHLIEMLDAVRQLQSELLNPNQPKAGVVVSETEKAEAMALLQRPDVLDVLAGDLEALGWVGEERIKRLLLLVAISRKLPAPLSGALLASSGSGKSMSLETIAAIVPPEDLIHVSRLTDSALYYHDKDALKNKLLIVDEADALTPEVLVSLRILQSRGSLTQSHVVRDPLTGTTATHFIEVRGPVAVLTSSAGRIEEQTLNVTRRDYLTLQEATALLQTQARRVSTFREGCYSWARAFETLAFLCVAIATGRRRTGLRNLRVDNLNFERNELRCEREKGKTGRVLPVAAWAMNIVKTYVDKARPVLDWQEGNEFLFVGDTAPRMGKSTIDYMLEDVHKRTVEENPDLTELAAKRITPHSLRVSFAKLLFNGGCNIRSVNELMMHTNLTTTAYYTPIPLEDMRRVCRLAHPRA